MNGAGRQFKDAEWIAPAGVGAEPIDRVLREQHPGSSWAEVRRLIETGKVSVDGARVLDRAARVQPGARVEVRMHARKPKTGPELDPRAVVYVDADVVVVKKPAGISTVAFDDTESGTLDELVRASLGGREAPLGVVHRIDKETSGLVLFARTLAAKRALKQQFRVHSVERRYHAIAHGAVPARTLSSRLVPDRGDGVRGSTSNPKLGRIATTHVSVLERFGPATFIECQLETGRTHQIRIHLAEAGYPLLGERVYAKRYAGSVIPAPRLMLHAFELGFVHPKTGAALHFEEPIPTDMLRVLADLRSGGATSR